jgi:hypothetical protein
MVDPAAAVVEAGKGANGADDVASGGLNDLGSFDNVRKGEADISSAAVKETEGMGVSIESGAAGQAVFVDDAGDGKPIEESHFDGFAFGVAANAAAAAMLEEVDGGVEESAAIPGIGIIF